MSELPNHDAAERPCSTGSNTLLLASATGPAIDDTCFDLLDGADPDDLDVLFVTFTKSPSDRLDAWRAHADRPPANLGIVSVADQVRSAAAASPSASTGGRSGPIKTVSDPSDLTGVGIAVTEFLAAWADDGNRTVVCFESLTALLQYADADRVYRFLNELTSRLKQTGAVAHFHASAASHDDQTLGTLASLFDEVIRPETGAASADSPMDDGDVHASGGRETSESDSPPDAQGDFVFPGSASDRDEATLTSEDEDEEGAPDSVPSDDSTQGVRDDGDVDPDTATEPSGDAEVTETAADVPTSQQAVEAAVVEIDRRLEQEPTVAAPVGTETAEEMSETSPIPAHVPSTADAAVSIWESVSPRAVTVGVVGITLLVVVGSIFGGVPFLTGPPGDGGAGGDDPAADAAPAAVGGASTNTSTSTATQTATTTPTPQPTATASPTQTPTPTATATATPTATQTATPTASPTDTLTDSTTSDGDGLVNETGLL